MSPKSVKRKLSVGTLRKAKKTKLKSPDLIGDLHLQRHTFEVIAKIFQTTGEDEIICSIAGWGYSEDGELYLSVQLSPPYQATKMPKPDILASFF